MAGPVSVAGHLTIPKQSTGIVVFAHGSGSSIHSPRNRYVADVLNETGLATVLFDNVAVTALELPAARWFQGEIMDAVARLRNFGAAPAEFRAECLLDG